MGEGMELHTKKPKTAKEGIIHILSTRFPLTAKQLTHNLKREHGMEIAVTVMKNPTLAKLMSSEIEKHYHEAKKHAN
jgi:hypothetical protein